MTKTGRRSRRSGLDRVSERLRVSLGEKCMVVTWDAGLRDAETGDRIQPGVNDAFLTAELFSEPERPGFSEFLASRPCRLAAVFHDAIPLKHPHITWPQSVARHPGYMKLLARFDRVWAVSEASRRDLLGFWKWQGVESPAAVDVLALGADFNGAPRVTREPANAGRPARPQLLSVGIIEPRKNQDFLVDVCAELWTEGLRFDLHIVGRVNPHFGGPVLDKIKRWRRRWPGFLHLHLAPGDATLAQLYATSHATLFPSIAEGCGLPLLESLWMGVPCVCSDLPVLRENASGGACLAVRVGDREAWKDAIRRILAEPGLRERLVSEAITRRLPTWADTAETLVRALA